MALDPVVNFFRSEIATLPLASGGTSMVITTGDGNKLPNPSVDGAFNLTIYNASDPFVTPEIVRCTAKSGDTLTITRAQEGTSATNKTSGSTWYVELTPTAKTIQDIDSAKLDKAGGTMTGDLTIPDKIIHSGDTNTFISFPSADTFTIETGGTERVRVDSSGNVGINTTNPLKNVVVSASSDATLRLNSTNQTANESTVLGSIEFFANDLSAEGTGIAASIISTPDNSFGQGGTLILSTRPTNQANAIERLRINSTGAVTAGGTVTGGKFVPTANTTAGNGMYLPTTNTVAIGTNGSERIRFDASGSIGFGVTNPAGLVDYASGLKTYRTTNASFNRYNITKLYGATNAQTVLQITVPNSNTTFVYIKMSFSNSRANATNLGISAVGERYFAISRNGSGSNVVLDSNIGSKDWTGLSSSAGSVRDVDTYTATIVRNGAEANTDPQVVNITFDGQAAGFFCYAILDFEILSHNTITIV